MFKLRGNNWLSGWLLKLNLTSFSKADNVFSWLDESWMISFADLALMFSVTLKSETRIIELFENLFLSKKKQI